MDQIDIDDKYVESAAYHEAGHVVVAAVQDMPLRNLGVHIDSLGCGKAFYWRRLPDGSRNNCGSDLERERTIISASAGLIAQKRFYSHSLRNDVERYMEVCAKDDTALIIELLEEMYSGDRHAWFSARASLHSESIRLVELHGRAVDALAKHILTRERVPRDRQTDKDGRWSVDDREKWLHGCEIVPVLELFKISAFIVDDSRGSYEPRLGPVGSGTSVLQNSVPGLRHD